MAHGNGHSHGNGHGHGNGAGHETRDTGAALIIYSSLGLTVGTFIICMIVWGMFNYLKYREVPAEPTSLMSNPATIPPEPRLQVDGTVQIKNLRAHEDHVLSSYAWVDQKSSTVRIPIDRAIDLLAQRGVPTRDYNKNPPPAQPKPRGPAQAILGVPGGK